MNNDKLESIVADLGQAEELAPLSDTRRSLAEPAAEFGYDKIHLDGGLSEGDAAERRHDARLEQMEAIVRTIGFIVDPAKTPEQLWRRAHLIRHWLRPEMDQRELARFLSVSPQAVSAGIDRLRQEISHFFTN